VNSYLARVVQVAPYEMANSNVSRKFIEAYTAIRFALIAHREEVSVNVHPVHTFEVLLHGREIEQITFFVMYPSVPRINHPFCK